MQQVVFECQKREKTGKSFSKLLRSEGQVPAVLYGGKDDSISLSVDPSLLEKVVKKEYGSNQILDLVIKDGSKDVKYQAIPYLISRDAISQKIEHVDFFRIEKDTQLKITVPVEIIGEAPGVKKGGVFLNRLKKLKVHVSPENIPASIGVDVTSLNVGDVFRVEDIDTQDKFQIINFSKAVIAKVDAIRVKVDKGSDAAPEASEETEGAGA